MDILLEPSNNKDMRNKTHRIKCKATLPLRAIWLGCMIIDEWHIDIHEVDRDSEKLHPSLNRM